MFDSAVKKQKSRLSRKEQRAARIHQLLEAAWAMFCAKGYEAVTIDDVAEHAGVSRMPIYSLFGDKQNLYFELWRSFLGDLSQRMLIDLSAGAPLRTNLERLARVVGEKPQTTTPQAPEGLFFVVQTIALSRPDIGLRQKEAANQVVASFAAMVRDSSLLPGERLRNTPEQIAAHLIAHINGMSTVEFQTDHRFNKTSDLIDIFHAIAFETSGA